MKNFFENLDSIERILIGALLIVVGIYLVAGYNIFNSTTFLAIVGIIFIIKGLSFIRV